MAEADMPKIFASKSNGNSNPAITKATVVVPPITMANKAAIESGFFPYNAVRIGTNNPETIKA